MQTVKVEKMEDVPAASNKMIDLYSQCYNNHNFSFRVLLPRSKDHDKINNLSRRIGMQLQSEFLLGIKRLKLKTSVRDYRYIHDKEYYGWLLVDPSFMGDLH